MKKTGKIAIRSLAILLILLSVAYLIPTTVFASMVRESGAESLTDGVSSDTSGSEEGESEEYSYAEGMPYTPLEETEVDAVCEDEGKREANAKHFLMSDGSYTMILKEGKGR